jgi:multidrug transporter EmrE-like cation transporter
MEHSKMVMTAVLIASWFVCFTGLNILLKQGLVNMSFDGSIWQLITSMAASPWAYIAVGLYIACAVFYLFALRVMPLSIAGPTYMTLGIFSAAATGILYFGEPLSISKIAGMTLCVGGVLLLALNTNATT